MQALVCLNKGIISVTGWSGVCI